MDTGLLDKRAFMNYEEWRDMGFAIRHATKQSDKGLELWLKFSKINTDDFDMDGVMKLWNKTKDRSKNPITIRSIRKWAKECNQEIYDSLFSKKKQVIESFDDLPKPEYFIDLNDLDDSFKVAEIISKTLREKLILCNEDWYMLTENNLWKKQKEPTYYIINECRKYITTSYEFIINLYETTIQDEKERNIKIFQIKNNYSQYYKSYSKISFISVIAKFLKTLLVDNTFLDKLDSTPHILAFKNGIVDLRTKQFRKGILSSDYISETIKYDYVPCNQEKKRFLLGVLKKILNNDNEHLTYFLSLIGYAFIGMPQLEKSIYFMIDKTLNSKGDNGKTLFFDILTYLMGIYVYRSKSSFIVTNNQKIHKQMAMVKGKRLVWLEEYPKNKVVNSDLIKEIADGKQTENEVMFGTSETINIQFKMFVLSNHIPKIEAEENAVYNRYKQVSYNSHFDRTGERLIEEPEKLLFIADKTLGDKIKDEYYNEVFDLIIEYANNYYERNIPPIPQQFIKDANDTKKTNDLFAIWFDDNCVIDINGKIPIKKIVNETGLTDKQVQEGMSRKGFQFDKTLRGMGKDNMDKYYKGGFSGVYLNVNNDDNDIDTDVN